MRREPEREQVHQAEDVICEASRVGVVLLDSQIRLVIQQPIKHAGRVPHADVDHLGAEGRVLVGDVVVEEAAGLGAVLGIDMPGALCIAARLEALTVRRRGGAVAPVADLAQYLKSL